MRVLKPAVAALLVAAIGAATSHAAFIVQPFAPGHAALTNFSHSHPLGPRTSTTPSVAEGLIKPAPSAFGSLGDDNPHVYTFSYTPGVDVDNHIPAAGTLLGTHRLDPPDTLVEEDQFATGLVGGTSGLYNVYVTWPTSGNTGVPLGEFVGTTITVSSDDADIVLSPINQNGDPGQATFTEMGAAGAQKWLKIGSVPLTAGTTYTVTMSAPASFVSQRADGVMWELVPEPSSLALLALGLVAAVGLRRRHS